MLYRNLLAMECEELLRSYPADGCVLMGGCDKTTPALVMGAISMNLPAIFMPAGPMLRGDYNGEFLGSGSDTWKYWAELRAGNITEKDWQDVEDGIARSPGHCMTMGTASTMTSAAEVLGLTLPGAASIPAPDSRHAQMATLTGKRIVDMVWEDLKPSDILTAGSFDNAVTAVLALGGSTNAIVHLIAMARRAGVALDLERFDALARKTPVLANLRPGGKYLMEDFFYAGGLRAFLDATGRPARLQPADRQRQDAGREHRRRQGFQRRRDPAAQQTVARQRRPGGADAATLRPAAPSSSRPRWSRSCASTRGPAVVFKDYDDMAARIDDPALRSDQGQRHRVAKRRPAGRSRHARVGAAADPAEAAQGGRARHAAHQRCPHERHQLRRLRAARHARIARRRAAGAGAGRRPDRTGRRRHAASTCW